MFTDMATANPVIFVNHVTALKNLSERQPVYIHQVVPIIGAVGTVNQVRVLTFTTLWANFVDDKFFIYLFFFFLIFPRK